MLDRGTSIPGNEKRVFYSPQSSSFTLIMCTDVLLTLFSVILLVRLYQFGRPNTSNQEYR
jgi:hypothetical protein